MNVYALGCSMRSDHAAAVQLVGNVSTAPEPDGDGYTAVWLTVTPGTSWPMRFKVVAKGDGLSSAVVGQLLSVRGRLRTRFNALGQAYLLVYAAAAGPPSTLVAWPDIS